MPVATAAVRLFSALEVSSVVTSLLLRMSALLAVTWVPAVLSVLSELVVMGLVVMEVKVVFALSLAVTDFCLFFMDSNALSFLACFVPL